MKNNYLFVIFSPALTKNLINFIFSDISKTLSNLIFSPLVLCSLFSCSISRTFTMMKKMRKIIKIATIKFLK